MKKQLTVTNDLLHVKVSEDTETIILPITNYSNVMNAPRISTLPELKIAGQPYSFSVSSLEEVTIEELSKIGADIIYKAPVRNFIKS